MEFNNKITDYLEMVSKRIRWKKAHPLVLKELNDHIIDQKNAFIDDGFDEEEAIDKAIAEMGDPTLVGKQLDHIHRPKSTEVGAFLLGVLLVLSILGTKYKGTVLVNSIFGSGDKILFGINVPLVNEIILFVGIFIIISSLAVMFAPEKITKTVIGCQAFIVTAIYLMEIFPRIRFGLLLAIVNVISFIILYRITKSIKTGLMWTLTSSVGLFLFVIGTQINAYLYNDPVNGDYGGFENVPKAFLVVFLICLVPQIFTAAFIMIGKKNQESNSFITR